MSSPTKNYKIIVDSKHFGNMRGISPAEVAKKAASKILGNSLNRTRFSIQENKKIRHYDAKRENLIRPYHKNGKLVKYRIVVKKMGKQFGGTYPPNLKDVNDPIFKVFPEEKYTIKISDSNISIYISVNWCCNFYIYENILFIDMLYKCNPDSGSEILKKIIEYGKYLKKEEIITEINLEDISNIEIGDKKFSLSLLSILSTGISWYNQFGFISKQFEEEKKHNIEFLSINLNDLFNICIEKIIEIKLNYYLKKLNNSINLFQRLNNSPYKKNKLEVLLKNKSDRNSLSHNDLKEKIRLEIIPKTGFFLSIFGNQEVKTLFTQIKNKLKKYEELSKEELDNIYKLLIFIESSGIIMYNNKSLTLTL